MCKNLPIKIIGGAGIVQIEILFLTVIPQRNARHHEGCNESAKDATLRAVLQTRPPEDIEVTRAVHVPRVDFVAAWVEEVIVRKHLIPRGDEVDINIVGDLQVTIHAEETSESTVKRALRHDKFRRTKSIRRGERS